MLDVLVPQELKEDFERFDPVLYSRIEDEMYSKFWDIVIVKSADDFLKVKDFSKYGTLFINVGNDDVKDAFNLPVKEALKALELFEKVVRERQKMSKVKRAQQLMIEPVTLNQKMARAYKKLASNSLSRLSIVVAENGLLEEWILWPLLENHEIMDFSVSSEEELLLRIFGTKNHPPLLSREGVVVLMSCDKCSEHALSITAQAASLGFFTPYLTSKKRENRSRVIFHFEHERNVPPFLKQLAGMSFVRIPPLREISESLPTILKLFVSLLGQEMSSVNTDISQDVVNRVKKSRWNENWREFLGFCKSFACGEEKIHRDLSSSKSLPKLKEYVKFVEAEAEKELLKRAIGVHGLNRVKLSKVLGINPKTLTKKLKLYGLDDKE